MAWRLPPVALAAESGRITGPEGSKVAWAQMRLLESVRTALASVANDVRMGLEETVGVPAEWVEGEVASVRLMLPPDADAALIAQAIDIENVEAWIGEGGQVHVAIGPWYSTKDVDQVVLTTTKVVHVLLGLHAPPPKQTFIQRILASATEVMKIQQQAEPPGDKK
ncbi:MAG: hypothetical protein M3X11_02245 [Acidobacteriota bacterium]|nr:hypothetical protein [Acidobacteriota bacterium]